MFSSEIISFFIVKSAEIKTDSNGRQYFDVNLSDKTGDVNGKKWDVSDAETPALSSIKESDVVKVKVISVDTAKKRIGLSMKL